MGDSNKMTNIDVDEKQVGQAAQALKSYVEKQKTNDLVNLIDAETVFMQIGLQKVPHVKNKIIKIPLPHRLIKDTAEVCLFVKDLNKKHRDHQPTVDHFEELLDKNGITGISKIIPLKQIKLEYQPFEAKRNLSNMYETYLVDDRIARLLPGLLGKNFYGRKRFPMQLKLTATNLKKEFETILSQTQCIISGRGSTCQVAVANTTFVNGDIVENVKAVVQKLIATIPGGPANVKTLHLKTEDSPSLPIYISTASANETELPAPKAKQPLDEPEELTTLPNARVRVTRAGKIQVFKDLGNEVDSASNGSDDEDGAGNDEAETKRDGGSPSHAEEQEIPPEKSSNVRKRKTKLTSPTNLKGAKKLRKASKK